MKNLIYLLPLLLSICLSTGCSDSDNRDECECTNEVSGISGKWKLEKSMIYFPGTTQDHSKLNITVEIKSEKSLVVHEYTPQEDLYFFEPNEYSVTERDGYYTVIYNNSEYWIYLRDNQLFIDLSQVDGPRYSFNCIAD